MADYQQAVRFNQNQLITPVVHNAASAPTVGTEHDGQLYFDTGSKLLYYWSVDRWIGWSDAVGEGAYQEVIGDGVSINYLVEHDLHTTAVTVQLYLLPDSQGTYGSSPHLIEADVDVTGSDTVFVSFGSPLPVSSVLVLVFATASIYGGGATAAGATGPAGPTGATGPAGATGPQGTQGVSSPSGLQWRGTWSASTEYDTSGGSSDVVAYNGTAYFLYTPLTGGQAPYTNPASDTGHWASLSTVGSQGPVGPQGTAGAAGAKGATGATGPAGATGVAGPVGPRGAAGAAGHSVTVFQQSTAPSSPSAGDIWIS